MRILLTGGSGFIAGHLAERLAAAGHELTLFDLVEPPAARRGYGFVRGDVRDRAALDRALEGCDAVFHLAAAHHDFGLATETYFAVNEGAARVLCDAMTARGIGNVVFYSSVAVYGGAPEPHVENGPTDPEGPYGASKLAGEKVFEAWAAEAPGRRALVIRPTVVFGRDHFANMYSLIRQIASGAYVRVGAGENVKSLVYVENIVAATLYLWQRPDAPAFDVFNVVDKPDLTSAEIADAIFDALGRRPLPVRLPLAGALALAVPFDVASRLTGRNLPISRARVRKLFASRTCFEASKLAATGFRAEVPLREGIARMVRWYMAEGRHRTPVSHLPPAEVGGTLAATHRVAAG
jgi:nucleoside-diphosphate-sugar epimerase